MKAINSTIKDSLKCKIEENNGLDPLAVSLILSGYLKEKVFGQVALNRSKILWCSLKLPDCSNLAMAIGKRLQGGANNGFGIPVQYRFFGEKRAVSWVKTQIKSYKQYAEQMYQVKIVLVLLSQ